MTDDIRARYNLNGFYIFEDPVLDASRVIAARQGMESIRAGEYDTGSPPEPSPWNPGDDPHALCKIEQPQKANRAIAELIRSSEIGDCVAAATGANMVQVWWVQLLYKPSTPEGGTGQTNVGWHQDWTYWHSVWEESSELLTAWHALSDVSERSGPMKFVPGSHQWKNVGGGDFFSQNLDQSSFSVPEGQAWREISAVMQAGGLSLHDKRTLHGSGQNTSNNPRCSLAIHLRTDKSRPLGGGRKGLARFIDDSNICPIICGSRVDSAFV
jgi:ectoine hydroxylase-related dioxygenase (phytanoyl-CoA dioxygenase family)